MNNSFEYYKVFYYVARYLNISKAAKVLSTGQPNVTRTIKKLESSLGCELFVRTNSGVILTKQGETLFQHIKEAFRQIDIGESKIEEETNTAKKEDIDRVIGSRSLQTGQSVYHSCYRSL